jgi:hypothetical protein
MSRGVIVVVGLGAALSVSCGGRSETKLLAAAGNIHEATLHTYGWNSFELAQDIDVTLAPNVRLELVFDMSVFGKLTPGVTRDQAIARIGAATRERIGAHGERWSTFDGPAADVEVGCYYDSSGGLGGETLVTTSCTWTLYAVPKVPAAQLIRDPQLVTYLEQARKARRTAAYRVLKVETADRAQALHFFVESRRGPGIYWYDRNTPVRREGAPDSGAGRRPSPIGQT